MTAKQLVALLVRLAGFYVALESVAVLPHLLDTVFETRGLNHSNNWWLLTVGIMWATAAVCMIVFPLTIAGNWLTLHGDKALAFAWDRKDIESFAFLLIGLYFGLDAVRQSAFQMAAFALSVQSFDAGTDLMLRYWLTKIIPILVQFALAIWLLLGAAGLRKLLRWARHSTAAQVDASSPES